MCSDLSLLSLVENRLDFSVHTRGLLEKQLQTYQVYVNLKVLDVNNNCSSVLLQSLFYH